jgi:hypothetical protein
MMPVVVAAFILIGGHDHQRGWAVDPYQYQDYACREADRIARDCGRFGSGPSDNESLIEAQRQCSRLPPWHFR